MRLDAAGETRYLRFAETRGRRNTETAGFALLRP
jgi:hypothetical protein